MSKCLIITSKSVYFDFAMWLSLRHTFHHNPLVSLPLSAVIQVVILNNLYKLKPTNIKNLVAPKEISNYIWHQETALQIATSIRWLISYIFWRPKILKWPLV
jgi:hypothetical protein